VTRQRQLMALRHNRNKGQNLTETTTPEHTETAHIALLRWRARRPFYVGDTNHLSHRLVRRGLSPTRAVLLIWTLAAAVGCLALVWI